jgi:hypothetical protein
MRPKNSIRPRKVPFCTCRHSKPSSTLVLPPFRNWSLWVKLLVFWCSTPKLRLWRSSLELCKSPRYPFGIRSRRIHYCNHRPWETPSSSGRSRRSCLEKKKKKKKKN